MYFSKNSRYVLQRGNWLSPSTYFATNWKKSDRNLSTKYPQEDPTKPSLRMNIPKDTQQAEAACSKFIHESANIDRENFNVETRSRSVAFKHPSLTSNLDKDLLKTCHSETRFSDVHDEILLDNVDNAAKIEKASPVGSALPESESVLKSGNQTTESLSDEKEETDYNEGLQTPLNDSSLEEALSKNYMKYTTFETDNKLELKENVPESSETDEQKTLYIIIDVPENEEKAADVHKPKEKSSPPRTYQDESATFQTDLSADKEQPKLKLNLQSGSDTSLNRDKQRRKLSNFRSEAGTHFSKSTEKVGLEVHDMDDTSTLVFRLRFKKNFLNKSCRVGCVPEKEINTRSSDARSQNGVPIRVRDPAPRKMLKNLPREISTVEDLPEAIRYSELKKFSIKRDNAERNKSKLWNFGTFKNISNLKIGGETFKNGLEAGLYFKNLQGDSKVQETNSENSVRASQDQETNYETSAQPQELSQTKSESSLNLGRAPQDQEADAQYDSPAEQSNSESSARSRQEVPAHRTSSEGSLNIKFAPQVQEANPQKDSQVQQTNSEVSLHSQSASQVYRTNSESSLNLGSGPQVQETISQAQEGNTQYVQQPVTDQTTTETELNESTVSASETTTASESGAETLGSNFIMSAPNADYQTSKKKRMKSRFFNELTSTDFHLLRNKQKLDESRISETKSAEQNRPSKNFNRKNCLEKKIQKQGKCAEFQFHSDSKASQIPVLQMEKSETDMTDFKTSASVINIKSEKKSDCQFSAVNSPMLTEAIRGVRRDLGLRKEALFNNKWSSGCESGSRSFELNPKCLSKLSTTAIFFPEKEEERLNCDCLFEGKKEVILNVGKNQDGEDSSNKDGELLLNESLAKESRNDAVDSLTLMKKVKEIIDFDLNNAIKIFEGRDPPSWTKKNISSVLMYDGEEWKVDTQELAKCQEIQKIATANEINMATFVNKKETDCATENENKYTELTDNKDVLPKQLPKDKSEDSQPISVITYNPTNNEFAVNEKGLELANWRRKDEFFDAVKSEDMFKTGNKNNRPSMREGDSILVFDEETQSWKVDFSILEKREEQMKQEVELRKASELILETFEKMEQGYIPNIPNPESREKRVFDYSTNEWKEFPMESKVPKSGDPKSTKSKFPFKESDAEEIRKKNSDLYDDLFVVKNETINKNDNKAPGMDSTKEGKSYGPNKKKEAKAGNSGSKDFGSKDSESKDSGSRTDLPTKETGQVVQKINLAQKDDGFWESFLKMDIVPKTIKDISKTKAAKNQKPQNTDESKSTTMQIKIPEIKFKIPFLGDKKNQFMEKKESPHNEVQKVNISAAASEGPENSKPKSPQPSLGDQKTNEFKSNVSPPSIGAQKANDSNTKPPLQTTKAKEENVTTSKSSTPSAEVKKSDDSKSKSPQATVELKNVDDSKPKSSPAHVEMKKVDDAKTPTPPPTQVKKADNPESKKSQLIITLEMVDGFKSKSSSPTVETKKLDELETKPAHVEAKKVEDAKIKSSPAVAEVKKVDDAKVELSFTVTEDKKMEDAKLKSFTATEVKKTDDTKVKSFPAVAEVKIDDAGMKSFLIVTESIKVNDANIKSSAISEAKKVEDAKIKSYSAAIETKKMEETKLKSSSAVAEDKKLEDAKVKLSSTAAEIKKADNIGPKSSSAPVEVKKTDDLKLKSSPPLFEVEKMDVVKLKPPSETVEVKKAEDVKLKSSPSVAETKKTEDLKLKLSQSLAEVKKVNEPKLKPSPSLSETKKAEDLKLKSSPSVVETKKAEDLKLKSSPSVAETKKADLKLKSSPSVAETKKAEDLKLKSYPSVPETKKADLKLKSSPSVVETKKAEDLKLKSSPSVPETKKAEYLKLKSSPSLAEVKKTDDLKLKSSPPLSETKKTEDLKLKSSPSRVETKKAEDLKFKSSPSSTEVKITDDESKSRSAQSTLGAQKFDYFSSKPSPPPSGLQKPDDPSSRSPRVPLEAQKVDNPGSTSPPPFPGPQKPEDSKVKPFQPTVGSQKTDYSKSKIPPPTFGTKKQDGHKSEPPTSLPVGSRKDKSASEHYISENILEMTRNSKEKNSKVKPNKIETVKLNITADKRMPSKITEINLNRQSDDKAKESNIGAKKQSEQKKPSDGTSKNSEKLSKENSFYKNFEKYKSQFSDPEFEEKPMKINSDTEGNPNLKKLDNWNKTLVLQDIVKPPENIESWLKDETDKMATLLLKVLQEAADGKPKRKPGKIKSVEKIRGKGNPYNNIRHKQEGNTSNHFLIRVHSGNISFKTGNKTKPAEEKKTEKSQESNKESPVQAEKMEKLSKLLETDKSLEEAEKDLAGLNEKAHQAQENKVLSGAKPKAALEPLAFHAGDLVQQNKAYVEITEDIPGPEILKKISNSWKVLPVLSTQITIFTLFSIFQLVKAGTSIFCGANLSKYDQHPFSRLFAKYGPIVNVQGPLSGNIILIHKPEHLSAVFDQDASVPARSVFDSLEQSRKQVEGKINSVGMSTDWTKSKWNDLKRALNDPLEKGSEKFFGPVELAGEALVNNIRRSKNSQNYVSNDFMEEIRSWSMEGLCNVLFEKSFSFLEGRSKNMNWMLEPDKLYLAVGDATDCLSKCERGFHTWRLMPTPSFNGLGQAYLTLSTILFKQLYQADLNLKNKNEILKDGILINSRDMTFMESMLLNDGMSMDEITCNLVDIMLIGINTMSSAMGFLLYDLSQNMRVQNKLLEEVKECLSDKTSTLDYHKLHSLKYLQACVKESIRLHMPVPIFFRVLQNDILLSNYIVSKGTYIVMDTKISGLKEQNFSKPDEYMPERWLSEERESQQGHPFGFFPFCHGPRAELAKRVVEMQLWACTAKVIRNFQIEYHHAAIRETRNFISNPDKPLKFNFVEREE